MPGAAGGRPVRRRRGLRVVDADEGLRCCLWPSPVLQPPAARDKLPPAAAAAAAAADGADDDGWWVAVEAGNDWLSRVGEVGGGGRG